MNKMQLTAAFLFTIATLQLGAEPIAIPLDTIAQLDGKFKMDIIVHFKDEVTRILTHNYAKKAEETITLEDLIRREQSIEPQKLQNFVRQCLDCFVKIAHDGGYMKYFHMIHPIFDDLLDTWAQHRKCTSALFYRFGKKWKAPGTELEILYSLITTISEYRTFLVELDTFLGDLTVTFPKSYAEFKQREHDLTMTDGKRS